MSDYSELRWWATYASSSQHEYGTAESVLALFREFDQMKTENAALREDAERYRWIRREGRKHVVDVAPVILNRETGMIVVMRTASADEQIDSLMAEDHG